MPLDPLAPTASARAALVQSARAHARRDGRHAAGRPHSVHLEPAASRLYGGLRDGVGGGTTRSSSREGSFRTERGSGRYGALASPAPHASPSQSIDAPPASSGVDLAEPESDLAEPAASEDGSSFGRASPRSRRRWMSIHSEDGSEGNGASEGGSFGRVSPRSRRRWGTWSTPSRGADYSAGADLSAGGWSARDRSSRGRRRSAGGGSVLERAAQLDSDAGELELRQAP